MKQFILLMLCIAYFPISAQFSISVGAGYNSSSNIRDIDVDSEINYILHETGNLPGYYVQITPSYFINTKSTLNLEVGYKTQGFTIIEGNIDNLDIYFRSKYIYAVPQYEFKPISLLSVYTGLGLGYQLKEDVRTGNNDWINSIYSENNIDVDIQIGIKLHYKKMYFTSGFSYGIKDVTNIIFRDVEGKIIDLTTYNTNFRLGLGYRFM